MAKTYFALLALLLCFNLISAAGGRKPIHRVRRELSNAARNRRTLTNNACPSGFQTKTSGEFTFCYNPNKGSQPNAKQICEQNGMQLVEIHTEEKAKALDSIASYDYTWLGLTCPSGTRACQTDFSLWTWEKSGKKLTDTTGFMNRLIKQGSTIYGGRNGENCAHWWKKSNGKAYWAPQSCSDSWYYGTLCEVPTESEGKCENTNHGATDRYGDDCAWYDRYPRDCGVSYYNDGDFNMDRMCCTCGGGRIV